VKLDDFKKIPMTHPNKEKKKKKILKKRERKNGPLGGRVVLCPYRGLVVILLFEIRKDPFSLLTNI
jgi:hypothetical protein